LLLLLYQVATRALGVVTRPNYELERQISAVFVSGFAAGVLNAFFESWMFSVGNLISLLFWSAVTGLVGPDGLEYGRDDRATGACVGWN
jgi:hypothetical protein